MHKTRQNPGRTTGRGTIFGRWLAALIATICFGVVSVNADRGSSTIGKRPLSFKNTTGNQVAFPDVCLAPAPKSATRFNSSRTISRINSEFNDGTLKTKKGQSIVLKKTTAWSNRGYQQGFRIKILGAKNKQIALQKSTLYEMEDGSYCAVCVKNGRITRLLKLQAMGRNSPQVAPYREIKQIKQVPKNKF